MNQTIIRVGIDDAAPAPMQLGTPDNSDFRGYEVDLLAEIARRCGYTLSFRRALWSLIIHELIAGSLDLICSACTITEERREQLDFCLPHLHVALAVVKRKGIAIDTTLKGLKVGVRHNTTAEDYARHYGVPEPAQVSESNEVLYASLASGNLDAVIDDSPIANYFSQHITGLEVAGILPQSENAYAIMIQKGNDGLRAEINGVLANMEQDKIRQVLLLKWFGDSYREGDR